MRQYHVVCRPSDWYPESALARMVCIQSKASVKAYLVVVSEELVKEVKGF